MKDQKRKVRIPWNHIKLQENTANRELNAVWTAVTADQDRWITFLHYVIAPGQTARIVMNPVMRLKLYQTDGEEQHPSANMMLAMLKVKKAQPTEICSLGFYRNWYDNTWLEQLNRELNDQLTIDTGYFEVLLFAGETLLFQVRQSGIDIPSTPHTSSKFDFPIDVINDAELKQALNPIHKTPVSAREVQTWQETQEIPLSEQIGEHP